VRPATGRLPACCTAVALLLGAAAALAQVAAPELAIRATRRPGLPARAAALLVSGQQGGPIAVAALGVPLAVTADRVRLGVAIDIEGTSLLAGRSTGTLPVDLAAYAVNDSGGVAAAASCSVVLDLDHGAAAISAGGIKLLLTLDAPLTATRLRALVYVPDGPSFGVIEVPLGAADAAASAGFIAPPVIDDPAGAWLLAAEETAADAPFPFVLGGEPVVPAARPVLAPAAERVGWLLSRGQPEDLAGVAAAVTAADGSDIAPVGVRAIERVAGAGIDLTRVAFTVPSLPTGVYGLRVSGAAAADGVRPTATLPIVIAPRTPRGEVVAWTAFAPGRQSNAAAAAPAAAPQGSLRLLPVATLKAAYLAALGQLAGSGRDAAIAAVAEMETDAFASGSAREAKRLLEAEGEATRELLAADPGSLLALLALHLDLHRRYGQTSRFAMQSHSSARIEELATAVAFRGGNADSRSLATAALSCFAGERHFVGDLVISARMYRKVLFLDPANPTALAGLGGVLEAAGLFKEAASVLELLVEKQPGNAEARLRLAVNLDRTGSGKRAVDLLETCTAPDNPAWVRAVAYQELVRRRIDESDWANAAALLDRALAALPGDQGLNVQRAFVLDRSGRAVEGRAASRRTVRASTSDSPRYRYARTPVNEAAAECTLLAGRREPAEAALARALAAPPGSAR
jgi:tetratricopeptide (TPR) repeat protein